MITDHEIRNGRILIVDDKEENILLLEDILDKAGYKSVLGTSDPRDVLDLFVSFQPDLLLLDINMPHMSGFDVMDKIKEVFDSDYLPVLVLTAYHDRETRLHALRVGARDFVSKPFDNEEVLCRIRNLLEVTLAHRQIKNHNTLLDREVEAKTRELHETRLEIIRRRRIQGPRDGQPHHSHEQDLPGHRSGSRHVGRRRRTAPQCQPDA